jgi:hypothetical protein
MIRRKMTGPDGPSTILAAVPITFHPATANGLYANPSAWQISVQQ